MGLAWLSTASAASQSSSSSSSTRGTSLSLLLPSPLRLNPPTGPARDLWYTVQQLGAVTDRSRRGCLSQFLLRGALKTGSLPLAHSDVLSKPPLEKTAFPFSALLHSLLSRSPPLWGSLQTPQPQGVGPRKAGRASDSVDSFCSNFWSLTPGGLF